MPKTVAVYEFIEPYYELCLTCPLPECRDGAPECPRVQAMANHRAHVPDGYVTTTELMGRLGRSRAVTTKFIFKYAAVIGARKHKYNSVGRSGWIIPEENVSWLVRQAEREAGR